MQPILANLYGSDIAGAPDLSGIVAKGRSPVLKLCRMLVRAGYDPERQLLVYRKGTHALTVRTLGEGAKLAISEPERGHIKFVPYWENPLWKAA